jgi:hypothetical protein
MCSTRGFCPRRFASVAEPLVNLGVRRGQHASVIETKEIASKRPTTIAEYIRAAPREGQPHLRRLYAILKSVAPEAEEAIKSETPSLWSPDSCSLSPRTRHTATSRQQRRRWNHFARNWKSTRLPEAPFSFPARSPCQRIWFARSLSTVSGIWVKTTLSGNPSQQAWRAYLNSSNVH